MQIQLKERRGPITDLATKRLIHTTAMLMRSLDNPECERIKRKAQRWTLSGKR